MKVRVARTDDLEDLAQLHVDCWAETYPGLLLIGDTEVEEVLIGFAGR